VGRRRRKGRRSWEGTFFSRPHRSLLGYQSFLILDAWRAVGETQQLSACPCSFNVFLSCAPSPLSTLQMPTRPLLVAQPERLMKAFHVLSSRGLDTGGGVKDGKRQANVLSHGAHRPARGNSRQEAHPSRAVPLRCGLH